MPQRRKYASYRNRAMNGSTKNTEPEHVEEDQVEKKKEETHGRTR